MLFRSVSVAEDAKMKCQKEDEEATVGWGRVGERVLNDRWCGAMMKSGMWHTRIEEDQQTMRQGEVEE